MSIAYSNLNAIRLAELQANPYHKRAPHVPIRIDYPDYPLILQTKEKRGTPPKPVMIAVYRGLDKRVVRGANVRYTGAQLRMIRARKGVGRPCRTA